MKRIVPIKIIPIHELKRGDLISYILPDITRKETCFKYCNEYSVLEFIEIKNNKYKQYTQEIHYKVVIDKNGLKKNSIFKTWIDEFRNHFLLVKIEDDGTPIESSNRAENENDEPRSVTGIERINQTI